MSGDKISAFVITLNEERDIGRALKSLSFCGEILVIDSGSTDKTIEIAKSCGARVIERPWPGYVEQKRFGLEQCSGDWVLNIDADEEVSDELRAEIISAVSSTEDIAGWELSRVVFYLGKWWRKGGWYPEYRLRLLKRSKASWGGDNPHERAIVSGRTSRLKGELRHYTYDNMTHHVRSLNNFAAAAAQSMHRKGKKFSVFSLIVHPPARFIKFFLIKKGFLEGFPGLLVAFFETGYVFLKYAKLWEIERKERELSYRSSQLRE